MTDQVNSLLPPLERAVLDVYDDGARPMTFDAVIGTPETVRVAHHRDAKGIRELLADGETPQTRLWEVRTYVRVQQSEGWAHYEPEGWDAE